MCYCIDSSNCTYPSGIYSTLTGVDSYRYAGMLYPSVLSLTQIPSLHVGCAAFDAILESTFGCFFDQICLSLLFNMTNIKPLNSTIDSLYSVDTKINTIIEQLFIESYTSEKDFGAFFRECQPIKCSYLFYSKGNIGFIFITVISLIGGLFVACKTVAILFITLYKTIQNKCFNKSSLSNETDEYIDQVMNDNFNMRTGLNIIY